MVFILQKKVANSKKKVGKEYRNVKKIKRLRKEHRKKLNAQRRKL
jgi:hypothetical protein